MKKITYLILFITSGIFSQTIQMPSIPEDGVVYQTTTLNAAVSAPLTVLGILLLLIQWINMTSL